MSSPQPKVVSQFAHLQLANGALLTGELAGATDGALELTRFKLKAGTTSGGKISLHKGMRAALSLPDKPWSGPVDIRISGVAKGALSLTLLQPDAPLAKRFLKTIAGESVERERGPSMLTGSCAEYTQILRAIHEQAINQLVALLPRALASMQSDLLELSTRIRPDAHGRNLLYETAVIMRQRKDDISRLVEHFVAVPVTISPARRSLCFK